MTILYGDPIQAYCTGRAEHNIRLIREDFAAAVARDLEDSVFAGSIAAGEHCGQHAQRLIRARRRARTELARMQ